MRIGVSLPINASTSGRAVQVSCLRRAGEERNQLVLLNSVSLLGLFQHASGRPAFHVQFQGAGGDPRLDTPATARCRTVSVGSASTFLLGWPPSSVSPRPVQPPSELEGRRIIFPPSFHEERISIYFSPPPSPPPSPRLSWLHGAITYLNPWI